MDIRFLGHACFELTEGDTRVLIDPFLTDNPKAPVGPGDLEPTHIFLTHGHFDHWGDVVDIATRTGAQCVAIREVALELQEHGVESVADPNIGGTVDFGAGWVRLVPAWHTSTTPSGAVSHATGLVIGLGDKVVYHLGDTALFSDLELVGRRNKVDVALMCIGGHYTMDRHDAVTAARLIRPSLIIPCHYDTFPPVETDVDAFRSEVESGTDARVAVLEAGETQSL